jgi:hypothetical protein
MADRRRVCRRLHHHRRNRVFRRHRRLMVSSAKRSSAGVTLALHRHDRKKVGPPQRERERERGRQPTRDVFPARMAFVVRLGSDQELRLYYGERVGRRSLAKLLTRNAARRIAANIAKLPELLQKE